MHLTITTTKIGSARAAELQFQGFSILDITVKSGNKIFAPTWDMVTGYKKGSMSKEEYTQKYLVMMRKSYKKFPMLWERILREHTKIALACYCEPGEFCHRHLLKEMMFKVAKHLNNRKLNPLKRESIVILPEPSEVTSLKGETELGRILSDSAHTPMTIGGIKTSSLEAYRYFWNIRWPQKRRQEVLVLSSTWVKLVDPAEKEKAALLASHGEKAKSLGEALKAKYGESDDSSEVQKMRIQAAMREKAKLPRVQRLLLESEFLPEEWKEIREELKLRAEVGPALEWLEKNREMFSPIPEGPLPNERRVSSKEN